VIRLRRTLERIRAHPFLGPILLIVLVLLLSMLFLHAAHDGMDAAIEVGAICLGIATFLGLLLLDRLRHRPPEALIRVRGDRGPPRLPDPSFARPTTIAAASLSLPLRR